MEDPGVIDLKNHRALVLTDVGNLQGLEGLAGAREREDMRVEDKTVDYLEKGALKTKAFLGVDVDANVEVGVSETIDAKEAFVSWCFGCWDRIRRTGLKYYRSLHLARFVRSCSPKFRPFTFCQ